MEFNFSQISRAISLRVESASIREKNGNVTMKEGCWCGRPDLDQDILNAMDSKANEKALSKSELQ